MKLTNAAKRQLADRARQAVSTAQGESIDVLRVFQAAFHGKARKVVRRAFLEALREYD